MTRLTHRFHRIALAVVIGLGVAATTDAQPDRSLDARIDRITQSLDLTAAQQSQLEAIAARYSDAERPDLWSAAADVHDVLTDAQIAQLRTAAEARRGQRGERRARGVRDGRRDRARQGRRGRGERRDRADRPALSEDQREALRDIRRESRETRETLMDQFRAGTLSDDAFLSRMEALRDETRQRTAALLPAEVAARHAERQDRREAAETAREDALGLTAAQKRQLQTLRLDRIRTAPERPDLRPYLDDEGRLDRRALRESQQGQREERRAAAAAHREALANVLTDEQQEIIALHRALAGPRGRGHRRGGRGR